MPGNAISVVGATAGLESFRTSVTPDSMLVSRREIRMRKRATATIVALLVAGMASPAVAEGSWTSYISGAGVGFSSRPWADGNLDAASTTIQFKTCTKTDGTGTSATVQLTRERAFPTPDENRGQKVFACAVSYTGAWGRQPAGNFHFTLTSVPASQIWVDYVKVAY